MAVGIGIGSNVALPHLEGSTLTAGAAILAAFMTVFLYYERARFETLQKHRDLVQEIFLNTLDQIGEVTQMLLLIRQPSYSVSYNEHQQFLRLMSNFGKVNAIASQERIEASLRFMQTFTDLFKLAIEHKKQSTIQQAGIEIIQRIQQPGIEFAYLIPKEIGKLVDKKWYQNTMRSFNATIIHGLKAKLQSKLV